MKNKVGEAKHEATVKVTQKTYQKTHKNIRKRSKTLHRRTVSLDIYKIERCIQTIFQRRIQSTITDKNSEGYLIRRLIHSQN